MQRRRHNQKQSTDAFGDTVSETFVVVFHAAVPRLTVPRPTALPLAAPSSQGAGGPRTTTGYAHHPHPAGVPHIRNAMVCQPTY